jgi:hypothetical protein
MGSFTLSIFKKIVPLLFCFSLYAAEVAGVKIPETIVCEGKVVPLSGAGIRTATFLNIKVFALAVYAPEKIKIGKGAELDQRPLCFEMTYLREFDNEDVDKAWDFQFKESAQHDYPALKEDVMNIKKYFGEIKGDRKESFSLTSESTKVFENGELKGEIKGTDFQKSFLSIWFGTKPPTKGLQKDLLKAK